MRYYIRTDDRPDSPTYKEPRSLHRMDTHEELILERWDPESETWVDNPSLLAVTGMGGNGYTPIDEDQVEGVQATLSGRADDR